MASVQRSPEYEQRLRSPGWAALRRERQLATGWHCERCGVQAEDLELHHKHYDTLGHERPGDVDLLCPKCHLEADAERRARVAAERWASRVEAWARRVYGDEWEYRRDYLEVEEEFGAWLERRGDEDEW